MTRNVSKRGFALLSAFVVLPTLWLAAPRASQLGANGTGLTKLTNHDGDDLRGDWSPKNNNIAFGSAHQGGIDDPRNEAISVMNADGTDQVGLTSVTGRTPSRPNHLFTMNADGTDELRLTTTPTPGFSGFPSWGKWAAQLR